MLAMAQHVERPADIDALAVPVWNSRRRSDGDSPGRQTDRRGSQRVVVRIRPGRWRRRAVAYVGYILRLVVLTRVGLLAFVVSAFVSAIVVVAPISFERSRVADLRDLGVAVEHWAFGDVGCRRGPETGVDVTLVVMPHRQGRVRQRRQSVQNARIPDLTPR